jgi:RimJ/RimL family protein N-acetyltransferase
MDDITIRRARPDDASALLDHIRRLLHEPGVMVPLQPDEFKTTVEEEREILRDAVDSANAIFLLAESQGRIVGELNCKPGTRRAFLHSVTLGMSVAAGWRGRGVGTRLMSAAMDWVAGEAGIKRVELFVLAENMPGIRLYQKFGFIEEGRRRQAVLHEGRLMDDLIMSRVLTPER